MQAVIDSGAEVNIIHPKLIPDHLKSRLDNHVAVSEPFSGRYQPLGSIDLILRAQDSARRQTQQRARFVVAEMTEDTVILGMPWLHKVDPWISFRQRTWFVPITKKSVR